MVLWSRPGLIWLELRLSTILRKKFKPLPNVLRKDVPWRFCLLLSVLKRAQHMRVRSHKVLGIQFIQPSVPLMKVDHLYEALVIGDLLWSLWKSLGWSAVSFSVSSIPLGMPLLLSPLFVYPAISGNQRSCCDHKIY